MTDTFTQLKNKLGETSQWLKREYTQLHTGRATPAILDGVYIQAYGTKMPINNIASLSVEDPKTVRVAPYEKGQIKDIEKAISDADLGLSVSVDDQGLRVNFPQLTEETRKKLVKVLRDKLEEARVAVRAERQEAIQSLEQQEEAGDISEDELERQKESIQKQIDATNEALEELFTNKEKEVTTI